MSWEGCEKEKQKLRFDVLEKRGACGGMQKSRVMQSKQQARRIICTRVLYSYKQGKGCWKGGGIES